MNKFAFISLLWFVLLLGCAEIHENPIIKDKTIKITFIHTSDIHSRLLPYRMKVIYTDEHLGLKQENEPFGGIAKIGYIVNKIRSQEDRVVYIDTGDVFQGAPIFNMFKGEAEIRAMSYLNPDVFVIGNHEFDEGLKNLIKQFKNWASFPILAANYLFVPGNELGEIARPYVIVNAGGVRIGIIGLGDFSSLSSITDVGNKLGIIPLNMNQTVQYWVNVLKPNVDLIVVASHAGFSHDEEYIQCTYGVDIVFGGHTHIALNPPKVIKNAIGKNVLLVHSGAFAKYVGRLDVVIKNGEVVSYKYKLIPVDKTVPEDPKLVEMLEPYRLKMNQTLDLVGVYGYSHKLLTKYGNSGGDSSLGNLVAEAIRSYARVDIGFTNTLGIRSNIYPGPITYEDLFNVFPFENSITLMYMSGYDIQELLDYNTRRSAGRGCVSQLQIAGLEYTMDCNQAPPECFCKYVKKECIATDFESYYLVPKKCEGQDDISPIPETCKEICECPEGATKMSECRCPPMARDIYITTCSDPLIKDKKGCKKVPLNLNQIYAVATNDYIAHGGSGFTILRSNNTQYDTEVPLREAVLERMIRSGSCTEQCKNFYGDKKLSSCEIFKNCVNDLSKYFSQFCDRVDKTDKSGSSVPKYCSPGALSCKKDKDCYDPEILCKNGECKPCNSPGQCAEGEMCTNGYCFPSKYICYNGKCTLKCEEDKDCVALDNYTYNEVFSVCSENGICLTPASDFCYDSSECSKGFDYCLQNAPSCVTDLDCDDGLSCISGKCTVKTYQCNSNSECPEGMECIFGHCVTDAKSCTSSAECGVFGECINGHCNSLCGYCKSSEDCPGDLVCSEGYCVPQMGECIENRCRTFCDSDDQCGAGEVCDSGVCMPEECVVPQTPEEQCLLKMEWKAVKRCLDVPCIKSEVDGRIKRILPSNAVNYFFKEPISDPEDIDVDYNNPKGGE